MKKSSLIKKNRGQVVRRVDSEWRLTRVKYETKYLILGTSSIITHPPNSPSPTITAELSLVPRLGTPLSLISSYPRSFRFHKWDTSLRRVSNLTPVSKLLTCVSSLCNLSPTLDVWKHMPNVFIPNLAFICVVFFYLTWIRTSGLQVTKLYAFLSDRIRLTQQKSCVTVFCIKIVLNKFICNLLL